MVKTLSLVFTVCTAVAIIASFCFQLYQMKKTKNFRFLHTDLFFLFFLATFFMGTASVAQMWDPASQSIDYKWHYLRIRGSWIIFSVVVCFICSYFFFMKVNGKYNKESQILSGESSELSGIEGEESVGDFLDSSREGNEQVEAGFIPNLEGNI